MFDIGFTELLLIAVVSLLVIGPERLPGTVRTVMAWVHRLRRGFNEIRMEVEQELHNDAVMQELKKTGSQIREQAQAASREVEKELENTARAVEADVSAINATVDTDVSASQQPAAGADAAGQDKTTP